MEIVKKTAAEVYNLLFSLVGEPVFPVINPTDSDDYVIYRNAGSSFGTTKDGLNEYNAIFDIIIVTQDYTAPVESMDMLVELFVHNDWNIYNYNENWSEGRFIVTFQISKKFNF